MRPTCGRSTRTSEAGCATTTRARSGCWASAAGRVARLLDAATLTRPWAELTREYFVAALITIGHDPVAAAEWRAKVEDRFAPDARWDWAREVVEAVTADGGGAERADDGENPLRAAVFATHAAELVHRGASGAEQAEAIWESVATKAVKHPEPTGRDRLLYRAAAGRVAARRWRVPRPPLTAVVELLHAVPPLLMPDEQLAPSELAMLEGLLEILERADVDEPGLEAVTVWTDRRLHTFLHWWHTFPSERSLDRVRYVFAFTLRARQLSAIVAITNL